MPPVDAYASYRHYADHIQPIWDELTDRGRFYVGPLAAQKGHDVTRALGNGPLTVIAGFPDIRKTRHRKHVFVEHGVGENWGGYDPHYSGGPGRESVELFLNPNQRTQDANKSRYPNAKHVIVGSPRVEYLTGITAPPRDDRLRVVVSFHWNCRTWANTTSALPHYQPHFGSWNADSRIEIRGHAHPRIIDHAEKQYAKAGIQTIRSFEKVIQWADVYAVDNSSTLFEAAACGLSVVLLDAPWFKPDPDSLRFGKYRDMGPRIQSGEHLVDAALHANHNHVSYDEMVTEIFGTLGGSAKRAAEAIENHDHTRSPGASSGPDTRSVPSQPSLLDSR